MISSCVQDVRVLFGSALHSDIMITTPDSEIPCHKIILASQSEFYAAYFRTITQNEIQTDDENIHLVLEWIYGVSAAILLKKNEEYAHYAADYYAIASLRGVLDNAPTITNFWISTLSPDIDQRVIDAAIQRALEMTVPDSVVDKLADYSLYTLREVPNNMLQLYRYIKGKDYTYERLKDAVDNEPNSYCNFYSIHCAKRQEQRGVEFSNKLSNIGRFYNSAFLSDVTLVLEHGERVHGHLALMTESFFARDIEPGSEVDVPDRFVPILRWMYTRTLPKQTLSSTLATAKALGIPKLETDIMRSLTWLDIWFALAEEGENEIEGGILDSIDTAMMDDIVLKVINPVEPALDRVAEQVGQPPRFLIDALVVFYEGRGGLTAVAKQAFSQLPKEERSRYLESIVQ